MADKTFAEDVDFLKQHVETIVLGEPGAAQICVVPAYQGRTMTSTTGGRDETSFGWINYSAVESRDRDPQINLYGGEDRFWLSPEGGQFSVFFDPGSPMGEFSVWRTPAIIDTEPFDLVDQTANSVSFSKQGSITNYSEFTFDLRFDRNVVLLDRKEVEQQIGMAIDDQLEFVAHESQNCLTNTSNQKWTPENGLLGIWMLCMNKPSERATILVPFKQGPESELGRIVTADYFGELDSSRLIVDEERGIIFFLGDGRLRSKLGLSYQRVVPVLGAWDADRAALTIAQFNLPESVEHGYTNNLWEIQDEPYHGDVINSYNDGPNESGGMLGPFYELETLSPALALVPGQSYTHVHRTIHLQGDRNSIDQIAKHTFGVGLEFIEKQFASSTESVPGKP